MRCVTPSVPLLCALLLAMPASQAATPAPLPTPSAEAAFQERVVYHINDTALARIAMRNIDNHLSASPEATIVVVTHGKGINFLLNDAKDERGAYAPQVAALRGKGVDFRVCRNTLKGRNLADDAVIMEARVVPSGVAEIGRLQAREGYVYLKP